MDATARFETFDQAADEAVRWLQRSGIGDGWLLTRRSGERWRVIAAADPLGAVERGDAIEWSEAVLAALTQSDHPSLIDAGCRAPVRRVRSPETAVDARAVACVPLLGGDGEAIGALSGLFRGSRGCLTASFSAELALLAGLLARLLRHEIAGLENTRRDERFHYEAPTDTLTHLPNRRAWEEKLAVEHERARRLGETSFVTVIDVGRGMPAGSAEPSAIDDSSLRRTALTLRYAVRDRDFIARVDDSRFAILGLQCATFDEDDISARIRRALDRAGVAAAVGTAASDPAEGHEETWRIAGDAMARDRKRLQGRAGG